MTETNTGRLHRLVPDSGSGDGHQNSAYLHASKVNPDVQFRVVWVYSWYDPAQEAAAAEALIEQGADILMQHTDSTAAITIAQDRGILAFGQASDMTAFAPESHLTGILDVWAPYYIERVQAKLDGTWGSRQCLERHSRGYGRLRTLQRAHPGGCTGRGRGDDRGHPGGRVPPLHRARSHDRTAPSGWPTA